MKAKAAIDQDLAKAGDALRRAAARARQRAEQTGTPFYVLKEGRIVDLNAQAPGAHASRERHRQKQK